MNKLSDFSFIPHLDLGSLFSSVDCLVRDFEFSLINTKTLRAGEVYCGHEWLLFLEETGVLFLAST